MANAFPAGTLETLYALFEELDAEGIRYCHWKSTHHLEKGLKGKTDLDLLLDRLDASRFHRILSNCDYKPFVSAPHRQYPAVEDYLGFDRPTGAIVHLHVHYRLILGDRYTKNYVIPLEECFLNHTRMELGVRVPIPELEIVVLAIRALLKYSDRDVLRDLLKLPGHGGIPNSYFREFESLPVPTNLDQIKSITEHHTDLVPSDLVLNFLKTIRESPRDGWTLFKLRSQVRQWLVPYERMGRAQIGFEYHKTSLLQKLPSKRLRDHLLVDRHKKPATGGLGIAFIGADGAGKSTCVKQISQWLGWRMNVHVFYMGTTYPSFVTKMAQAVADAGYLVGGGFKHILGKENPITHTVDRLARILACLDYVAEARDRYTRYLSGQRKIAQGAIVIYDRYPLKKALIDGRAMDGARIASKESLDNPIIAKLALIEEGYYRTMRLPDHILVLQASPAVSQARKPEHRRERIEAKANALAELTASGLNVLTIDAEQPLEQVLLQIKTAVWSWL